MATQPKPFYTFEEYLGIEREASFKSEYRDGTIVSMSGGTAGHSELSARMVYLLSMHLKEKCSIYDSNLRLYIEHFNECTYSDAMVVCGERKFWQGHNDVLTNPTAVVEVLSPSTQKYDRTTKSGYYRSVPSLVHLVLVSQDRTAIEWSVRRENTWTTTEYKNGSDITPFGFLVEEVYEGILSDGSS